MQTAMLRKETDSDVVKPVFFGLLALSFGLAAIDT